MQELLLKIKSILLSPRFISFYWTTGLSAVVGFITLVSDVIPSLGVSEFATVMTVSILAQITKALNNLIEGKEMGFCQK